MATSEATSASQRPSLSCAVVHIGQLEWQVAAPEVGEILRPVLADPERYLANKQLQFKSSRVVTVVRVPAVSPDQPSFVLRRLNYGKLKHRCRDFCRPTRALRAFRQGLMLEQAGVATPHPIAAAEVRCCRWPLRAYLVTQEIPGARTLAAYLRIHRSLPVNVSIQLAQLLARLHECGFSHRDLKSTNLLLDDQLRPWLIDLDGLRFHRVLSRSRAEADLIRFSRGLNQYPKVIHWAGGRFLTHYCELRGCSTELRGWADTITSA